MEKLGVKQTSLALGATAAAVYIECLIYGVVFMPNNSLHHQIFELFPGFVWLNIPSFIIGLIVSTIYGLGIGAFFAWVYNLLGGK